MAYCGYARRLSAERLHGKEEGTMNKQDNSPGWRYSSGKKKRWFKFHLCANRTID